MRDVAHPCRFTYSVSMLKMINMLLAMFRYIFIHTYFNHGNTNWA